MKDEGIFYTFAPIGKRPVDRPIEKLREYMEKRGYSKKTTHIIVKTVKTIRTRYKADVPSLELAMVVRRDMEERNLSDFTIRGYLYALQYWARSMDINLTVPGKPRPACKMPYAYTRDQVYQLLQACKDIREYAVLFTSLSTGVRPHELINMDVEDVDFEHHRLYLRVRGQARKKVNVEEKVTMSRRLEDVLRQWLNNRPGSAPTSALFITVHGTRFKLHGLESLFMRVGRRAGLQIRVFPYRARHTAFTFMAEDGFSNSEIMLQSRHRDPRILDGYLHPHEDALKEKLDKQYRL